MVRLCQHLALAPPIFGGVITYLFSTLEEALMQAKAAGKMPGCHYGGITLPDGKRGFAVYRDGKAIGWYSVWGKMP